MDTLSKRQKVATVITAICELTGFILMVVGNEIGEDILFYVGAALAFGVGLVFAIFLFIDTHAGEPLPIKKVLVCGIFLIAGAALAGLFVGVYTEPSGWTPVGYEILMASLPIILSILACVWYCENHD